MKCTKRARYDWLSQLYKQEHAVLCMSLVKYVYTQSVDMLQFISDIYYSSMQERIRTGG